MKVRNVGVAGRTYRAQAQTAPVPALMLRNIRPAGIGAFFMVGYAT